MLWVFDQRLKQFHFRPYIVLCCVMIALSSNVQSQTISDSSQNVKVYELETNSIREEIQRYFGYEDLLYRYLTIPYDINQNVNQTGRHVDLGFVFLALLPLLLLAFLYRRKVWFYSTMFLLVIYLGLCFTYSHVQSEDFRYVSPLEENWDLFVASENQGFGGDFLVGVYELSYYLSMPLRIVLDGITGSQDHVTYPIMLLIFLGSIAFCVTQKFTSRSRFVLLIGVSYYILWWLLSGGIIWYGCLMIPLFYAFIARGHKRLKFYIPEQIVGFGKNLVLGVLLVWIFMGFAERTSYINQAQFNPETAGQEIESSMLMLYSAGVISADECKEISAPNVATAIRKINSDERIVFRVGTHLEFEINNNYQRVFEDNTLATFFAIYKQFPNDSEGLIDNLKSRGIGYLLIDLNTPQLDKTPEQSLLKKFQVMLQVVYNNPKVELVATDREFTKGNNPGSTVMVNDVFPNGGKISKWGTYAVYEIL